MSFFFWFFFFFLFLSTRQKIVHGFPLIVVPERLLRTTRTIRQHRSSFFVLGSAQSQPTTTATTTNNNNNNDNNTATSWIQTTNRHVEALKKKYASLQQEHKKAERVTNTYEKRATLLHSHLYLFRKGCCNTTEAANVTDWENDDESSSDGGLVLLTLNPDYKGDAVAEVEALFAALRQAKRATERLGPLLHETDQELQVVLSLQQSLLLEMMSDDDDDDDDQERLEYIQECLRKCTGFQEPTSTSLPQQKESSNTLRRKKPCAARTNNNIRKFSSPRGSTIYVGRNQRGNEYLSLSLARDEDVWMHARGLPGAHVLVRNNENKQKKKNKPTMRKKQRQKAQSDNESDDDLLDGHHADCLQLAANLAAFYSDGRSETKVEITTTAAKHVQKPRNAPLGAVKLRQESVTLQGRPDNVPEACKEAREQSGFLANDYRATDKAKLRRQSAERSQEQRKKKKAAKKHTTGSKRKKPADDSLPDFF